MSTPAQPRVAAFNPNTSITWSDSTPFNGYVWIALVLPTNGVTPWVEADFGNAMPGLSLPLIQMVPIVGGIFNASCGLFYNADITPPATTYVAQFYDAGKRLVSSQTAPFTVTTATVTIPTLTITAPSSSGPIPTPDS